jgi:predicted acetyltransferase
MTLQLVHPTQDYLPGYVDAVKRGWSPNPMRSAEFARETLEQIARDPQRYLKTLVDREPRGEEVTLPDGSRVPRLPGYTRWMWDGEFCGMIGFRWQPGTNALPETCLGHIGYAVVPWKQRRGYATEALRLLLPDAKLEGLRYVELTTDPENVASQKVIEANGGVLIERFMKPTQYGGTEGLRYRIAL